MNVHHLELFYYVARHGGISRAVRNMPYGIQQPAVSGQILMLEEDLGAKLFERQPFKLTREGEELYAFVQPFFENLIPMADRLRKQSAPSLRIGASELVLRDYLPAVMGQLRRHEPRLRLTLRSGFQREMEGWLIDREIDLAIVPLESRPPARLHCLPLLRLPLVLLVHRKSKIKSAEELWARDAIAEPLIGLPPSEPLSRNFRRGLKRLKVDWPLSIEASSMGLVTRYVANGYGVGVNLGDTEVVRHSDVRALRLNGFDPIEIAALWSGEASPLVRVVLEESQRFVARHWPDRAVVDRVD
ncbi:MAG: LysR family transcriptional regulator [Opitutaceae bacterium]|nr:LysR family transcriptional regulator [Opitutaceae bacterium]